MKTFQQWLEATVGDQIQSSFDSLAKGIQQSGVDKVLEYAKRIIQGESSQSVLQGLNSSGSLYKSVMQKVQELKNEPQPDRSKHEVDT